MNASIKPGSSRKTNFKTITITVLITAVITTVVTVTITKVIDWVFPSIHQITILQHESETDIGDTEIPNVDYVYAVDFIDHALNQKRTDLFALGKRENFWFFEVWIGNFSHVDVDMVNVEIRFTEKPYAWNVLSGDGLLGPSGKPVQSANDESMSLNKEMEIFRGTIELIPAKQGFGALVAVANPTRPNLDEIAVSVTAPGRQFIPLTYEAWQSIKSHIKRND